MLDWGRCFDRCIRVCEPALTAAAACLVLLDAAVFFRCALPEILDRHGTHGAALHTLVGIWLLFNVLFNHAMCVFTPPGCTLESNREHCPWMACCIGHANTRYFLLYLFYMWVGSIYSALIFTFYIPGVWDINALHWPLVSFLCVVLSVAVAVAMCLLWGMHVWLVLSGQGTIDAIGTYLTGQHADSASRRAAMRNNPYNLGPARNWREAFHVNGHKLWYLTWCLPSRIPRQGRPWELPRRAGHRITFADGSV